MSCPRLFSLHSRTGKVRDARYLMGPIVWQSAQHSVGQGWTPFFPQLEQQNGDEGWHLHGDIQGEDRKHQKYTENI